ncbi:Uncharacterised protein [Acinetobacter baumannii]|nr:Uncharacterised protein [Acinetobacter baumannii]
MFQFIQQQTELVDVLQQMDQCSTYGLDTEFIKVDTRDGSVNLNNSYK